MCTAGRNGLFNIVLVVGTAAGAFAQSPAAVEPAPLLDKMVQDLGSDDVILRIDAQRRLTNADGVKLREIEGVIKSGKVGPEQRRRLLDAAYARFCLEPRAAMGIQSPSVDPGQRGLVLGLVMQSFPSADVLRVNDRLLTVDGQTISDITDMQRVVFSHDPGDEVPIVLVRDGAMLHVKVKLGRYGDLKDRTGQPQQLTEEMLSHAWEFRAAAYPEPEGRNKAAPIESGISAADWKTVGQTGFEDGGDPSVDPRLRADQARLRDVEPGAAEFVAAGEARGAVMPSRLAGAGGVGPNFRLLPGEGQVLIGPQLPDGVRQDMQRLQAQRDEAFRSRIAVLKQSMAANTQAMKGAPENQRRALMAENAQLQAMINQMEAARVRQFKP